MPNLHRNDQVLDSKYNAGLLLCFQGKAYKGPRYFCKSSSLTPEDVTRFFDEMYKLSKSGQDAFMLRFMCCSSSKRKRVRTVSRRRPVTVKYHVPNQSGQKIRVCAKAFMGVACVTADRLQRLARKCSESGGTLIPTEARGGRRSTGGHMEITASIKAHISSFKCRESHYGRGKSVRGYLPPTLSVKRMWIMWKAERVKEKKRVCSYQKYWDIFVKKFNLGFGNPRTDVCSLCESLRVKIRMEQNSCQRQKLITEHRLHKLRAQRFYQELRSTRDGEITVCFDMEQNQPLPKLPVSEVFYARQVWIYNLTVMIKEDHQGKDNTHIYTWLETEAGRGANEVCSAVLDFITWLDVRYAAEGKTGLTLRLFSDACASQNKNTIMITVLSRFIEKSKVFQKVVHYFPIRGHSFLPPDRVFGRIEQRLRKTEKIVCPKEYHTIFSEYGTVMKWGVDWQVKDFKSVSKTILKSKLPVKLQEQKVVTVDKAHKRQVGFQTVYSSEPIFVNLLKPKSSLAAIDKAKLVPKENQVKEAKSRDVSKLMTYFEMPSDDESRTFYDDVLHATGTATDSGADIIDYADSDSDLLE